MKELNFANHLLSRVFLAMLLFWSFGVGCSTWIEDDGEVSIQLARDKEFKKSMAGVVLQGFFTVEGARDQLTRESYTIVSVSKLTGDYWLFNARIKYADIDVTLPIPVTMTWVNDTPVLSLTDIKIPGLGTFTARVLFYGRHYVGIWQHGKQIGQHFGLIIPNDSAVER